MLPKKPTLKQLSVFVTFVGDGFIGFLEVASSDAD